MDDRLSDQEVKQLKKITEGGVKGKRGHWYTLGIRVEYYHGFEEQLDAIKKLGDSKDKEVLAYIKLLEETTENTTYNRWVWNNTTYHHPNVKGELSHILDHTAQWDTTGIVIDDMSPKHGHALEIIRGAISKLENSLKHS